MLFKVKVTERDTFHNISIWLLTNFTDGDYALSSFHGWLLVDVFDEQMATMFKLTWHHTVETMVFDPRPK